MPLVLRTLTPDDEAAFLAARHALRHEPQSNFALHYQPDMTVAEYVRVLNDISAGRNLPPGYVASTMLFGFVGPAIVGRLSIRHELNAFLLQLGGHIGYVVVPEHRRKGYATEMLRQGLRLAAARGLHRVLLTCDDNNVASRTIIESCGGVFENMVDQPTVGVGKRRYWIST